MFVNLVPNMYNSNANALIYFLVHRNICMKCSHYPLSRSNAGQWVTFRISSRACRFLHEFAFSGRRGTIIVFNVQLFVTIKT